MGIARSRRIWSSKLRSLSNFNASRGFSFLRFTQCFFQNVQDGPVARAVGRSFAGDHVFQNVEPGADGVNLKRG
jgi:hypothetical protein